MRDVYVLTAAQALSASGMMTMTLLGGILGFSSRGVIGWIIRLIVVRFGWGLLKRVLGRFLGGR